MPPTIYRPEGKFKPGKALAPVLYAEPKYDGRWTRILLDENGHVAKIHGHRHGVLGDYVEVHADHKIVFECWGVKGPPNTVQEGELVWPHHLATEIPTAIKTCSHALRFLPFACPVIAGRDMSMELYGEGYNTAKLHGIPVPPILATVPRDITVHAVHSIWQAHADALPYKCEGIVLKGYYYADWWKYKPPRKLHAIVTAVNLGNAGKWGGEYGSIRLGLIDTMCPGEMYDLGSCGTGFDDTTRHALSPKDKGRVCLIEYDELTVTGKLKFPRFKGWLPMSAKTEATVDQLPSDDHNR